jgi:hypothetical protein
VVECLPSISKSLDLIPRTAKKKKSIKNNKKDWEQVAYIHNLSYLGG